MQESAIPSLLFYILAIVTCGSAIAVVMTQNIVRAAAWLLFSLAGTAGIFFLLGADFVGATQLFVYVGGTLVLVVFGVMLTAQGPFINMKIGAAEWVVAAGVGLLFFGLLAIALQSAEAAPGWHSVNPGSPSAGQAQLAPSVVLGESLLGLSEATTARTVTGVPSMLNRPRVRMNYLLPFEIVSVHLLVVLIGAAYLARAKRRRGANP